MLSVSESGRDLSAAFVAGARGYVLKRVSGYELLNIVRSVHNGETYFEPSLANGCLQHNAKQLAGMPDLNSLTKREKDILCRVSEGMTNKEIALSYKIAEKTVKHYMTSILMKLQLRNRVEAALVFQKYEKYLKEQNELERFLELKSA